MLNINNLLPLMQMMSQNKNQNLSDILNAFSNSGGQNNNGNMSDIFKNLNNPNIENMLKNMQGGNGSNNLLSMLPMLQNMFQQKPNAKEKAKESKEKVIKEEPSKDNYLKPISKIANKDITYILNRYFS